MFKYFEKLLECLRQISDMIDRNTQAIDRNTKAVENTNLDAPRFHEKLNAMNVPKLSDDGDMLSCFERLCLWCREVDRVRSGKKYSWEENETAASRGSK